MHVLGCYLSAVANAVIEASPYLAKLSSRLRDHPYLAGGDDNVAGDDLCPLRQGAPDLCDGPRNLGKAPGCATPGCPFARTAQQQYTRELLFSSLVQLMSEVVLGVHPTVHAAYQANKTAIGVSTTALYNKLDRVETGVSAALVRDSAALAEPVVKALRASQPRWLPGYQIKVLDGNHLSSTEHRLKALRGTWAAPFPGQALVVLDQQRMLITDVFLSEDGHAQERRLIAQVLQHVRGINSGSKIATFAPWA